MSLPPVFDIVLDDDKVAALIFDVRHAAELIAVNTRDTAGKIQAYSQSPGDALDAAFLDFRDRKAAAMQLRYRFHNEEWWDTLLRTPDGVRLVRISHTQARASEPEDPRCES